MSQFSIISFRLASVQLETCQFRGTATALPERWTASAETVHLVENSLHPCAEPFGSQECHSKKRSESLVAGRQE